MILGGLKRRDLVRLDQIALASKRAGREMEADHDAGVWVVKASSGIELVAPFGGVVDDVA